MQGAIAAAISLRSYLLVTPYPKPSRTLTLRFTDIGLDQSWKMESLPWRAFSAPGKKHYYFDSLERLDPQLMGAIKPFVDVIPGKVLQAAATSFLFLFLMIGSEHSPGAIYTMRSTIPIGAGLGSSASIAVCLSAALQIQSGTLAMPFKGMMPHETQLQLKRVNNWAFVGEMCIHGNPSGVDNTVATGGKAVFFKRDDYSQPPDVIHLKEYAILGSHTKGATDWVLVSPNCHCCLSTPNTLAGHLSKWLTSITFSFRIRTSPTPCWTPLIRLLMKHMTLYRIQISAHIPEVHTS
jgi:mevalonate kinase